MTKNLSDPISFKIAMGRFGVGNALLMSLLAGVVLAGACTVILVNLIVDLALPLLDPRIGAADA